MSTERGNNGASRREFMRNSGVALTAAAMATLHGRAQAAAGQIKVGLIGCGGRGTGALRNALLADESAVCYALADTFEDQLEECLKKMKKSEAADRVVVDKEHSFVGFDAFQKLIDCCDVVLLATPPAFRPRHLRAVVDAGKHCFCEKPVAVDGPGIRSVMESVKLAKEKKLSLVSGLCYRYENKKRETIKRIQEGAVGDIITIETVYNTSALWHKGRKKDWTEMEYQIRNWLYFNWLSGDHITEQHIHSLDKMMWVMGDKPPMKAWASGGRTQRTDEKYGNIFDHFNTVFQWENGVRGYSSCRQWENAVTAVYDNVYGTNGIAKVQEHIIEPKGGAAWAYDAKEKDDMYQNELDALFKAVQSGEPDNNCDYMITSNMAAIMGRMAAYSGQEVTWDQALNSDLSLAPEATAFGDAPEYVVPVPGKGKFF